MRLLNGRAAICLLVSCIVVPGLAEARFNSVDPLQKNFPAWSPYVYAQANPFKNIDPDGQATVRYDIGGFLTVRQQLLGWAPNWIKEFVAPVDPVLGPSAMASAGKNLAEGIARASGELVSGVADDAIKGAAKIGSKTKASEIGKSAANGIVEGRYEFEAISGKPYVGQSGSMARRLADQVRSGKGTPEAIAKARVIEVRGGKTAREIAEQQRIDELGGVRNLENQRNPIGAERRDLLEVPKDEVKEP